MPRRISSLSFRRSSVAVVIVPRLSPTARRESRASIGCPAAARGNARRHAPELRTSRRTMTSRSQASNRPTAAALRSRRRFLEFFPDGFRDETYVETERAFKWEAHRAWTEDLGRAEFDRLLGAGRYAEIARRAVRIEGRTQLLFSFEKMALRDAVRTGAGARTFALGLHEWIYGAGADHIRFERWCEVLGRLPRRQTRVVTWPLATVFGFIARPRSQMFMKPVVTRRAADAYGFDLEYRSKPAWPTYASLLAFARRVSADQRDLGPRDMIDAQSFIWVQGSAEYD